ncbi:MAG: DUF3429 domain-containing protein [Betaproteobacteria bacterium]
MLARPPEEPVPPIPLWLGAGGLIPFVVLAGAIWVSDEAYRVIAYEWLRTYAAVVLSFVGALHWGFAMLHPKMSEHDRNTVMGWSVVPALVAWLALLAPLRHGLALTGSMFALHYAMDRALVLRFDIPGWYIRLRGGLTIVVVICLAAAAVR